MSTKPCLSHDLSQHKVHYERRRPEASVLYQLVQENLDTFLAQMEAEPDGGLPEFVKDDGARLTRLRTVQSGRSRASWGISPARTRIGIGAVIGDSQKQRNRNSGVMPAHRSVSKYIGGLGWVPFNT